MKYLQIAEIANKCEVKTQQIAEHFRMLGAHPNFTEETKDIFYAVIKDMQRDLVTLEGKLRKYVMVRLPY